MAGILDTPHLALVVHRLPPELIHRIIERCGIDGCGELLGLVTGEQLTCIADLDLWHGHPGLDERFDADRFGTWLEVLVEADEARAATQVASMDPVLVVAGLAHHVRVIDPAATGVSSSLDGAEPVTLPPRCASLACEIGGYTVTARREDAWNAMVTVLVELDRTQPAAFHRVMRGCRALSNATPEVDGLDDLLGDPEQAMFDLTLARERRRERLGYVTRAQARAFLHAARQIPLEGAAPPAIDPVASAYFRAIDAPAAGENAEWSGREPVSAELPHAFGEAAAARTTLMRVLFEEGLLSASPPALLEVPAGEIVRFARMRAQMRFVAERDPAVFARRSEELAYLANVVMAGCSVLGRPFTSHEASDAAVAVCNLGLECWPARWLQSGERRRDEVNNPLRQTLPEQFLLQRDLVGVFQVGWAMLYRDVGLSVAEGVIDVLQHVRCADHDVQFGLNVLRLEMTKHWKAGAPWRARQTLDVIGRLDMPAWAALAALVDEFPVEHAALPALLEPRSHTIDAARYEFIAEVAQLERVREFMRTLPGVLGSPES